VKRLIYTRNGGFTLAESVIALGILVVLITGFLAVFGPAADSIRRTLSGEEASQLQDTLVRELSTLRGPIEKQRYDDDSFKKTLDWIANSHLQGQSILIYKYRADPTNIREDGTMERYRKETGIAGTDFIIQPMARRITDNLLEDDLEAIDGRAFFVKLSQMIFENGEWETVGDSEDGASSSRFNRIVSPYGSDGENYASNPDGYPEAMIVVEAGFYF